MSTYGQAIAEDVRVIVLRALAEQTNHSLNETLLLRTIEAFGHQRTREYLRNQLRWLAEEVEAVTLQEAGSILIATITRRGLDHVERRAVLEGVGRISPGR